MQEVSAKSANAEKNFRNAKLKHRLADKLATNLQLTASYGTPINRGFQALARLNSCLTCNLLATFRRLKMTIALTVGVKAMLFRKERNRSVWEYGYFGSNLNILRFYNFGLC